MSYDVTDFNAEVLEASHRRPVLVDFWAPWCGPCKALGPVLERLADQAEGAWTLAKVNTEAQPDLAAAFEIRSIPALKLFHNGEVIREIVGALPENELRRWLAEALPSPLARQVEAAQKQIADGDLASAQPTLEQVLAVEPTNEAARLLLAEVLLTSNPNRSLELLAGLGPDSDQAGRAEPLRTLALIASRALTPAPNPDLDPLDALFHQAAQAIRNRDFATALQNLIEVISRRKDYADGAARDACKAIFQFLGLRHPITDRYHRAFTSTLYS